ncbi:endo-alpha-N-acetylgalactosaminidase family protein [uncultured Mucilaginibacter sp.]|uniref:endo-alpha-N-acetylgalactosaminidase family protein n=1 Tax=uncultured Mucilaginibacter sp. TaxID=797541 RepID=UPI0025FBA4B3|nr:endo-alpha-N-acetylgalactosaminidase family protein [uncultured Mucilaginibacter sp.]
MNYYPRNDLHIFKKENNSALWLRLISVSLFLATVVSAMAFAHPRIPKNLATIKSPLLTVNIDRTTGLPYNYLFKGSNIWGVDSSRKLNATVCRLKPRQYIELKLSPVRIKIENDQADILFEASLNGRRATSFHIKYVLKDAALVITMDQVREFAGFELIETAMPDIATVHEEDGGGWLAHSMGGGELVDLKNARSGTIPFDGNFGDIGYVLPVAVIGLAKVACVMEVSAFMDGTKIEISGGNGHHHARIGTTQVYRVHGGRSYDMNDGGDRVSGNNETPNLLVGQQSRCRFDFTGGRNKNGAADWLDGARIVADRMPASPTTYFNDRFVYLIAGKYKPDKEPRTTFEQSEKLISDIAALTDYAPQLPLISGWVYDGQDTGFPSEDKVNESIGGYEGLKKLISDGPRYNANVSLNVNYDDAYKSSPQFDTAFIARRPDGRVWRSRDWAGEYSFIVGMAKYMKKWGTQRINYTMDRYKIHDALLIDAMSWFAIRNDWDPQHPASGYKNLVDGKYQIIDALRDKGIAVMSEHLRYPFIGKLAISADGFGGGSSFFGGEPIPLIATIYRKSAIWGTGGDFPRNDPKRSLFWNCRSIQWYNNSTDRNYIIDYYFLTVLPFSKVHDKPVEDYTHNGFTTKIKLAQNSYIENDWMGDNYSITANGVKIAANNATFCPIDSDRVAFFSRESKTLSAPIPSGWTPAAITARALYTDHRSQVKVDVEDGRMQVEVNGGIPVIIYRNSEIADRKHE